MVWSAINQSYDLTVSKVAHCSLLWNNFGIFLRHKYMRVVLLEAHTPTPPSPWPI